MAIPTPQTQFTRDILGNYVCNTLAEATGSGLFDVVIIGGGTFGLVLAQDLFFRTQRVGLGTVPQDSLRPANYRILVLEAGPFVLPDTLKTFRIYSYLHPDSLRPRRCFLQRGKL